MTHLLPYIEQRLLGERGDVRGYDLTLIAEQRDPRRAARLQAQMNEVGLSIARPGADRKALLNRLTSLEEQHAEAQRESPRPRKILRERVVRLEWMKAQDDTQRRTVLMGQIEGLRIVRGTRKGGRPYFDPSRVQLEWKPLFGDDEDEPTEDQN